jgi:hypothetical protein
MPRLSRATYFLALVTCAIVAAACGDPFAVKAPYAAVADSFAVSALTGTPVSARTLWRISQFTRYRIDSLGATFDLGFDINASGRVVIYPARTIAITPGTTAAPPRVALQSSTGAYAQADRAPETGYTADTALVVNTGQLVFVRSNSDFCLNQPTGGTLLYAKVVVDSVNTTKRELYVRTTIQPSCNFRSFAAGVPTF